MKLFNEGIVRKIFSYLVILVFLTGEFSVLVYGDGREHESGGVDCLSPSTPGVLAPGARPEDLIQIAKQAGEMQEGQDASGSEKNFLNENYEIGGAQFQLNLEIQDKKKLKHTKILFGTLRDILTHKKTLNIRSLPYLNTPLSIPSGKILPRGKLSFQDVRDPTQSLGFETSAKTAISYSPSISRNGIPQGASFEITELVNRGGESELPSNFNILVRFTMGHHKDPSSTEVFILNNQIFSERERASLTQASCEEWESKMADFLKGKPVPQADVFYGICKKIGKDEILFAQKAMKVQAGDASVSKKEGIPFSFSARGIGKKKFHSKTHQKPVESFVPTSIDLNYEGQNYSADVQNKSFALEISSRPQSMDEDPLIQMAYTRLLSNSKHHRREAPAWEAELFKKLSEVFTTKKNQSLTNLDWVYIRKLARSSLSELHHRYGAANDTQIVLLDYLEKLEPQDKKLERKLESRAGVSEIQTIAYQPTYESQKISIAAKDMEMGQEGLKVKEFYVLTRNAFSTSTFFASGVSQGMKDGKPFTHFTHAKMRHYSPANRIRFGVASAVAEVIPGLRSLMGKEKVMNVLGMEFNTRTHEGQPLNGVTLQGSLSDFVSNLKGTFDGNEYNYQDFSKTLLQSNGRYEIRTRVSDETPVHHFSQQKLDSIAGVQKAFTDLEGFYNRAEKNLTNAYIETKYDPQKGHAVVDLDHMRDGFMGVVLKGMYSSPKALIRTAASMALPYGTGFFLMDAEGIHDGTKQFFGHKRKLEDAIKFETNKLQSKPVTFQLQEVRATEVEEFKELEKCQSVDFKDQNCVINTTQDVASVTVQQISNSPCVLGKTYEIKKGPPTSIFVRQGCQLEVKVMLRKLEESAQMRDAPITSKIPRDLLNDPQIAERIQTVQSLYVSTGRRSGTGSTVVAENARILGIQFKPAERKYNWCQEGRDYGFHHEIKNGFKAIVWAKNHCHGFFDVVYLKNSVPERAIPERANSAAPQKVSRRVGRD